MRAIFSLTLATQSFAAIYNHVSNWTDTDYAGTSGTLKRAVPLTDDEKFALLHAHNEWRDQAAGGELTGGKVSPKMPHLRWSDELAASAQAYSNVCNWAHSSLSGFDILEHWYGENLFVISRHDLDLDDKVHAIDLWSAEHVDYDHDTKDCTPGKMCGHYTQVVWEKTKFVGCAVTECDYVYGIPLWANGGTIITCQYYPPGNVNNNFPYTYQAPATSQCNSTGYSSGAHNFYTNLCDDQQSRCSADFPFTSTNRCHNGSTCEEYTWLDDYTCDCPENFHGKWCEKQGASDDLREDVLPSEDPTTMPATEPISMPITTETDTGVPEPDEPVVLEMTLTDADNKIRLGSSFTRHDQDNCVSLEPYVIDGVEKLFNPRSQIIYESCDTVPVNSDEDPQQWTWNPIEGTICLAQITSRMVNKGYRLCFFSSYKNKGARILRLAELYDDRLDAIPYKFQFDYEQGFIVARHVSPKEVVTFSDKNNNLWVRPMRIFGTFGSVSEEEANLNRILLL